MSKNKVKLNGKEITREQLEEKKKKVEEKPGMSIVEKKPGEYRTKLQD